MSNDSNKGSRPGKGAILDHTEFNRRAWDAIASSHRKWFYPASADEIMEARSGNLKIKVTATKNLPATWLGKIRGSKVLCLAGGGGHQGPLLAAAGGIVTVADFSEAQLAIDQEVAVRESLDIKTVHCDMRDLGDMGDFDMVVNPCSVNFCADVPQVWREAYRILRSGGVLISGFINPINYLFDPHEMLEGRFIISNQIPYLQEAPNPDDPEESGNPPTPVEFGHTLGDLIGGQLDAGFRITDFFEDRWGAGDLLSERIAVFAATRSVKP